MPYFPLITASDMFPSKLLAESDLAVISDYFLNQPYQVNCLGEGSNGIYDQSPLYRFDVFDCVSYVEMILALAITTQLDQFRETVTNIRYRDGKVKYEERNHFMSIDWSANNARNGLCQDISSQLLSTPISYASCIIDKPQWYQVKKPSAIKLASSHQTLSDKELLADLQAVGKRMSCEKSVVPYIPIVDLFDKSIQSQFIKRLPPVSIIQIVKPDWDLKASIGTHLNISHLGFAIKTADGVLFRHASEVEGKVVECDLFTYLSPYRYHEIVKGINVLAVTI